MVIKLSDQDRAHLATFVHRGASNVDEEMDKQRLLYRQLLLHVHSDTVAHSAQMLWLYFEHLLKADQARAGREHLLCLLQCIRAQDRRMQALKQDLAAERGGDDGQPPHDPQEGST